jgi:uncharacterized protein Usg
MLILNTKPVLLQVIYYNPEYPSLLQEFTWGYDDILPELYRTHKFLTYWQKNIDAIIQDILLSIDDASPRKWRGVDTILSLN